MSRNAKSDTSSTMVDYTSPRLTAQLLQQALAPPPPLFTMTGNSNNNSNHTNPNQQADTIRQQQFHHPSLPHFSVFNRPSHHHPPINVLDILQAAIEIVEQRPLAPPYFAPSGAVAIIEPEEDEDGDEEDVMAAAPSPSRRGSGRQRPSAEDQNRRRRPKQ